MKSIDGLIAELCPNGVEYCPLGKECDVLRGMRLTKDQLSNDYDFPVFHGGIVPIGYYDKSNRDPNTVMVINVGASAGTIGFSSVPFWSSDGCFCLKPADKVDSKFLYYALKTNEHRIKARMRVAGIPTLDVTAIKKLCIPIPHIKIQREIVRILDGFTGLIAELEAELSARRKQYEQYRNKLLTFGDDIERKPLGEIFEVQNGYTPSKSNPEYWTDGDIPWFRMEDIRTNGRVLNDSIQHITKAGIKGQLFPANSIIISTLATIGEHALILRDFLANQQLTNMRVKREYENRLSPKFIFYVCFELGNYCRNNIYSGGFSTVSMKAFRKFPFPIPLLPEQKRIVEILDKFDALCNDETAGLVAEIAARKKQYEYYRDRLLNFKRKEEGGNVDSPKRKKRNSPRKGSDYYTEDGMERLKQSGMKGHETAERLIAEQIGERHRLLRPLTREAASILKSVKGMIPRALFLSNAIVREAERRAKKEKT